MCAGRSGFARVFALTLLASALIPAVGLAAFVRNDGFDFRGVHTVFGAGPDVDNLTAAMTSDGDFRTFKVHARLGNIVGYNIGGYAVFNVKVDFTSDGPWDFDARQDGGVWYTYPPPANGISETHTMRIELDLIHNGQTGNKKTFYTSVTVLPNPRVFSDPGGNSFVQLKDEDPTNKVPLLIVEGVDPLNTTYQETYSRVLSGLLNEQLYPAGYEVFVLNFANGGDDLRNNANVVLSALDKVHELCPSSQIALVGMSMGGVICRYALSYAEAHNAAHNVGLFVSYDAPQKYAHVNPDLQDEIFNTTDNIDAAAALQATLNSTAAKQLLGYNTYDRTHSYRIAFQNDLLALNGNGYPHQCYNVAISNGNLVANGSRADLGRHLADLLFMVNGEQYPGIDVNAVELDLNPGSLQTNFEQEQMGHILAMPLLPKIDYRFQVWFSPTYMTTWSALDLQGYHQDADYTIDVIGTSPFDEYLLQRSSLMHSAVSTDTRTRVVEWLSKQSSVSLTYSLVDGGTFAADVLNATILRSTTLDVAPRTVNVDGRSVTYKLSRWSDGPTANPRNMFFSRNATIGVVMKGVLASSASGADWSVVQRRIATGSDPMGTTYHSAYESAGAVWYTRNIRLTGWQPEILLSSGTAGSPSIAVKSFGGLDQMQVAVGWVNGDGTIGYRSSTISNGSAWNAEVSRAIATQPSGVVVPDLTSLIWVEGASGSSGVYYYKNPQTNASLVRHLVPGAGGNVAQATCVTGGGCLYQLGFVRDGHIWVQGFVDPDQSNASVAPVACGSATDLTSAGWVAANPSLTINGLTLYAVWDETSGSSHRIAFREATGGTWSSTTYFTHAGHAAAKPVVGVDQTHAMLNILWDCGGHVALSARPLGGAQWTAVSNMGVGTSPTLVDTDPNNSAVLISRGSVAPYSLNTGYVASIAEPAAVTDLGVDYLSCSEIYVSWTAPSVAGYAGVAEYDLRYSDQVITDANFYSMSQLYEAPGPPGTYEGPVGLSGLAPGTKIYFALKSKSGEGIWSPMSNLTWARTLSHAGCDPEMVAGGPSVASGSTTASSQSLPLIRYELTWAGRQLRVLGVPDTDGTDSVTFHRSLHNDAGDDTLEVELESATLGIALRARDEYFRLGTTWQPTRLNPIVRTQGEGPEVMRVTHVTLRADDGTSEISESEWATSPGLCGVGDTLVVDFEPGGVEEEVNADEWFVIEGDPRYAPRASNRVAGPTAPAIAPDRLSIRWVGRSGLEVRMASAQMAKVEIFDLIGRRARIVANRMFQQGIHSLEWDGRRSDGSVASRGVYLCRVTTANGSAVTKLVR